MTIVVVCQQSECFSTFCIYSAPAASTGGFSFGTPAPAPAPATTTAPSLGLGGGLFGQKPGGFSFNTSVSSNDVPQILKTIEIPV